MATRQLAKIATHIAPVYQSPMPILRDKLKTKGARGGLAVLAYAGSIAASFFTAGHVFVAVASVAVAIAWNVYLFWPEIKRLKIVYPRGTLVESPIWLYIFGVVALGMVGFAFFTTYRSVARQPALLTAVEFSEPYIHGKYFHIAELADSTNVIEGRTFEDCYIYGPVVLYGHDNLDLQNNVFVGTKEQTFIPAIGGMAGAGTGIVMLKDCKFRRCHFINVSIIGDPKDIEKWKMSSDSKEEP
jgi:hypothetical protein